MFDVVQALEIPSVDVFPRTVVSVEQRWRIVLRISFYLRIPRMTKRTVGISEQTHPARPPLQSPLKAKLAYWRPEQVKHTRRASSNRE